MIKLKDGSSACWDHFGQIHPKLGVVFYDFCNELKKRGCEDVVVTSIIREKTNDSGIHKCKRAIDVRSSFPTGAGQIVKEVINERYPYDIKRPKMKTVIFHKTEAAGDAGWHYHIQVMEA